MPIRASSQHNSNSRISPCQRIFAQVDRYIARLADGGVELLAKIRQRILKSFHYGRLMYAWNARGQRGGRLYGIIIGIM